VDEYAPISALQHLLYCERQCALIHLDREWSENRFTAEGRVLHENAHSGVHERRPGVRITRGLAVVNRHLRLTGQCDIVEFHADGRIIPVEYKRGRPKEHKADEVQLCAQAMALEEMMEREINVGYLYYGEKRRRTEIVFNPSLRTLTCQTADRLHALLAQGNLPQARYIAARCRNCSLIERCQPRVPRNAGEWFETSLRAQP